MKLDSEEQRDLMFKMLGTVTHTVTWENARVTADRLEELKRAIETADIEDDENVFVSAVKGYLSGNSERPQDIKAGRGVGTEG